MFKIFAGIFRRPLQRFRPISICLQYLCLWVTWVMIDQSTLTCDPCASHICQDHGQTAANRTVLVKMFNAYDWVLFLHVLPKMLCSQCARMIVNCGILFGVWRKVVQFVCSKHMGHFSYVGRGPVFEWVIRSRSLLTIHCLMHVLPLTAQLTAFFV